MVHLGFIIKTHDNNPAKAIPYLRDGIATGENGVLDARFYFHLGDAYQRVGQNKQVRNAFPFLVLFQFFSFCLFFFASLFFFCLSFFRLSFLSSVFSFFLLLSLFFFFILLFLPLSLFLLLSLLK